MEMWSLRMRVYSTQHMMHRSPQQMFVPICDLSVTLLSRSKLCHVVFLSVTRHTQTVVKEECVTLRGRTEEMIGTRSDVFMG